MSEPTSFPLLNTTAENKSIKFFRSVMSREATIPVSIKDRVSGIFIDFVDSRVDDDCDDLVWMPYKNKKQNVITKVNIKFYNEEVEKCIITKYFIDDCATNNYIPYLFLIIFCMTWESESCI